MKAFSKRFPHYYVPPCPECGSRCTGRYIRRPLVESWYTEEQSLKNGEIIRFIKTAKEPVNNCFCVDCGYEWGQLVSIRFMTREELDAEIRARGTQEAYEALHEMNTARFRKKKKNPAVRAFHWIFG